MQVAFFPRVEVYGDNPYWQILKDGLQRAGVEICQTNDRLYLQWRWLVQNRSKTDVLHFHHLKHHYSVNDRRASYKSLSKFAAKVAFARLLGYRVVWTMHNLHPHERVKPERVFHLTNWVLAQLANSVIVHCEYARQALSSYYGRRKGVIVIEHPNYIDAYPNAISRGQARRKLAISDTDRVFLFLGAVRPYKGVEKLARVFGNLEQANLKLMVVGKMWDKDLEEQLKNLAAVDNRIGLYPDYVPDKDLQIYFNAADAVVLPYSEVLSSGSALLAMSFSRAVIAPSIGCLKEVITENSGILYDESDPDGLCRALKASLEVDLERLGSGAYSRAREFTWMRMVDRTLQAYGKKGTQQLEVLSS
ncbi:MAG: glycosyltransferase family 4 protein [Anaerolineales bacterium]|jgi:beta-1,4-mannosyltransferase